MANGCPRSLKGSGGRNLKAISRALVLMLVHYGLAYGQSVSGGGNGSSTVSSGGTNGALYRDSDGTIIATATGGAGTLCYTSANGGTPVWGSCAGSAATALSSVSAAVSGNTVASGDNAQIWNWALTTASKSAFTFGETTAATSTGTPYLLNIQTLATSTANPLVVTAVGTANGVQVLKSGFLSSKGAGGVDSNLLHCDVTDGTKCIKNVLSGITTATTRNVTWPDAAITVARSDAGQTFTGTQTFGALVATTINGNTFTTGTGVLTIAAGKTATVNNTLTFTGTDSSSVAFGAGGTVAYTANNLSVFAATTSAQLAGIISDETGSGVLVFATSPALVTPALGVATATSLAIGGATLGTNGLAVTGHLLLEGVTSTGATGTGLLVFGTSPTFVTPALGTIASGVGTNLTGTATGLTSGITNALKSATTTVDVSAATAPSANQVLTATDSTHATWTTPAGSGTVTHTGNLTALSVMIGNGTADSKVTNIVVDSGLNNLTLPAGGILTAPGGTSTGTSPPSLTSGTGGAQAFGEGTVPSVGAATSVDVCYADSTLHGFKCSVNNGSYVPLVLGPSSSTNTGLVSWSGTGGQILLSNANWTISSTTLTGGASAVLDLSAASATAGLKIPVTAGAAPTADGFLAVNSTTHVPAFGSNGSTFVVARTDSAQTFTGVQTFGTAIAVGSGGTGASTFTAHGPLVGETTSAIVATSPGTTGQCYLSNGASSDPSFQACPGGAGAGSSVTSTTPVTVNTNSTSDQQLIELSLGAGYFNSSKQPFLFDGAGVYTTQTAQTPTITLKIKLCTVSGCGSGTVVTLISIVSTATIAAVTNNNWNLAILGYTATTGATGNLEIHGPLAVDLGALTTTADSVFVDTNTAVSGNIDLTAALFVDFTIAFSTNAVTANTFTQRSGGVMPFAATAAPVTSVFTQTGAVGNLTGDVTTTNTTATTIANDAVTTVKILNANVTAAKMVNAGVFTGDATSTFPAITIGSGAITSAKLNITTTTCTAPTVLTAISATGTGTCTAPLLTQNSKSAAYTTVLGDAGKQIYHPEADTTARTWTIDSNANVAYSIGTCITFINDTSAGTLTIAITSDTMILAGAGTTGSRTLTASNLATACKMTTTRWIISGSSGLT